jgi:glucosylceramidase
MLFKNERLVHEAFPNTHLLFTEGCVDHFNLDQVHDWNLGEKYGRSMIHDFNAGTVGWTDWNVLLDEHGGPNHVGNYCFAPIIGDTQTGKLIYTNIYYYIGQFSKFVRPGAKRIVSSPSSSFLLTTAFVNKDGSIAVIVMNPTDRKIDYHLWVSGKTALTNSLPHSISTILIR